MAGQLNLALQIGALPEEARLRVAYERCRQFARRVPFEAALREPLYKHCLELTARAMQRKEERGRV